MFAQHQEELMSALSDKIAEVQSSVDESIVRVTEDVADLNAQIEALRQKVTTPEDIAALDAIKAKTDGLDPVQAATLPAP
jgi:hypothetical protein